METKYLRKWTRPRDYMGASWPEWYVFLGRHRDSDLITVSNFEVGLKAVEAVASRESVPVPPEHEDYESATVQVVHESHWAVGWVEWIAIHESDTAAIAEAERLLAKIEGYPVLDEDDLSKRESEAAEKLWDCFSLRERVEYCSKYDDNPFAGRAKSVWDLSERADNTFDRVYEWARR